jgi:hypothetical protein
MNGFQKEVRDRMLSVIAHIEVMDAGGNALADWRATAAAAQRDPRVTGAAPYIHAQGLVGRGEELRFSIVRGIDPAEEGKVTDLARTQGELLTRLKPGEWNIVLGWNWRACWRTHRRQGHRDLAQWPDHTGRRGATPEAVHAGGRVRCGPLRIRQRPGPDPPG